jgi:hypothetical protein
MLWLVATVGAGEAAHLSSSEEMDLESESEKPADVRGSMVTDIHHGETDNNMKYRPSAEGSGAGGAGEKSQKLIDLSHDDEDVEEQETPKFES